MTVIIRDPGCSPEQALTIEDWLQGLLEAGNESAAYDLIKLLPESSKARYRNQILEHREKKKP